MSMNIESMTFAMAICMAAVVLIAVLGWVYSLWADEVSIVAPLWPLMVLICASIFFQLSGTKGSISMALQVMIALWSLRMSYFLFIRNQDRPEQRKYRLMRIKLSSSFHFKSLASIFLSHGLSAWIASLIFAIIFYDLAQTDANWSMLHSLSVGVFVFGLIIQTVADYQLHAYNRIMERESGTYGQGLWRYSRHPNYFAECCIWWSWGGFALPTGNFLALVPPMFITFLMVKVKAAQEVEDDIASRRKNYENYIKNTSFMVPWRPRF